jgi:hypothetical protein
MNQTSIIRQTSQQAKSLNIVVRKRENDRIERENHAFAKRLFSNLPTLKKRDMDVQYEQHVNHRSRISKAKKLAPLRL